ncbi:MAG: CopD family protein [Hyphomicrobiales bacterium]|nr:CopD family protein [Hyphomicrobiales bacterium]
MLWVKTLHLLGVMGWMAGIFYLPRLLVNLAEAHAAGEPVARLQGMAVRLFRFCLGLGVVALAAGLWLWLVDGVGGAWLHWKLAFVAALIVYYLYCGWHVFEMAAGRFPRSGVFYRVLNEGALVLIVPILIFAVVKIG